MPNSYFKFKQFTIYQDGCAMKVCTDSCLFGAVVPLENASSILDIGTGTGLLALMAAQRSSATIQAVELDKSAAQQATHNFATSPWNNRISLFTGSIQNFEKVNTVFFDVIISNPPFYQSSYLSGNLARNLAMHATDLPYEDLARFIQKFLTLTGSAFILLPPAEAAIFTNLVLSSNLFITREIKVYTKEEGKHIRSILQYTRNQNPSCYISESISIRDSENNYTPTFRNYLEPFYLIF